MPRDAAATRARLITAARAEFAERGIDGARVDRIARQAGVSKERIYGHFGSKEELFETVVREALREHTAALDLPSGDIGEYVGRVYDLHRANPELLRLLLWEALHYGDAPLPDEREREEHYARKTDALARTLGIPPDGSAAFALVVTIALAAWPVATPQLTRAITGGSDDEALRGFLVRFARQALAPHAPVPGTGDPRKSGA
ncbi:MAG: TetR family transcriptional regulator [Saccharothrix sp.]|nr:TetR family transcriptional regulator [Saccharothrix sp.]